MDSFRYSCNLLNHLLILSVTVAMCWKCLQMRLVKTATHAFLCTLGFVLLMSEGMMMRYRGNILTATWDPATKTTFHWVLQLIGGLLGIAGTIQKVVGKEHHFRSVHGKLGLAACIFCMVNFACGFLALYSVDYRDRISPLLNHFVHNFLGLVTFLVTMACQFYGYQTGFFRRNFTGQERIYKVATCLICGLTAVGALQLLAAKLWQLMFY